MCSSILIKVFREDSVCASIKIILGQYFTSEIHAGGMQCASYVQCMNRVHCGGKAPRAMIRRGLKQWAL